MTKQEFIEEMVGVMAASNNPFVDVPIEIMPNAAEAIYNAGYRKIQENAVVLTREEYERQQKDNEDFDEFARSISDIRMKKGNKIATFNDLQDYIELQVKQGSKEITEKVAQNGN